MYDAETNWLCDEVTPMCSKDPAWLDDDPERKLLLPSTKYPADRYGPPFNYAPGFRDKSGKNVPIPLTYIPARSGCGGGDAGGDCWSEPEQFRYANDARVDGIWRHAAVRSDACLGRARASLQLRQAMPGQRSCAPPGL